jgi:hypothetical protein
MTPQRALIEAAEEAAELLTRLGHKYADFSKQFEAAISSAKAAEEGVETRYVVEVRCPKKYGPNWDSDFGSLAEAQRYLDNTHDAYYVCSIVAVETRRFTIKPEGTK